MFKKKTSRLSKSHLKLQEIKKNEEKEVTKKDEKKDEKKEKEKEKGKLDCGSDRVEKDVIELIRTPLSSDSLYPNGGTIPDHLALRKHFEREGKLKKEDVIFLLENCRKILKKEKNVVKLSSPVVMFGDLHGKFFDLVNYIKTIGECDPKTNKFLFLGDYVDRGFFGVEIVLNHECRNLTSFFNFKLEVIEKYDEEIYEEIIKTFYCLPLAAIVDKQFFCVHGGISPKLKKVSMINSINRFKEVPTTGLFGDLLWSDPHPNYNDNNKTTKYFTRNNARNCSFYYSYQAVRRFLLINKLTCIIRAHEAQEEGFRMYLKMKETEFPSLITIFSSPNYVGIYNNKSALFKYKPKAVTIKEFQGVSEPYWLPKFVDIFSWSTPFIIDKTALIWNSILSLKDKEEESGEESQNQNKNKNGNENENKNKNIKEIRNSDINKIGNKQNNIFLSIQRGEIIKTKIGFLQVIMSDFLKMRKKKGKLFLSKKGINNVRRGHSILLSSVLQRNKTNSFQIQSNNNKVRKKGLLRSRSVQDFALEDILLLKKLAMKFNLNSKKNKKTNIQDSKTKNILNNSFNNKQIGIEDEEENENDNDNENENEFENELKNLSIERNFQNSEIPQTIEIERASEIKKKIEKKKGFPNLEKITKNNTNDEENDNEDESIWMFSNN
ncbi:serine/threonine-protein phosphatase 2b catalytic subunit 1-related [Anaeramoeba flamelloides]|uniref:Serine/threonine-protein phosphatase 2b catalytic subunit 1-related n=1 Tax=Anaeramoeba flamelloides TaxID=1746091 RepID=A0AAV8ADY6_9EUKA|nr:serine/threonine-protein phosphatase 2b catalytic subunit 1-related [Anaeramoeba flamelloides]